MMQCHAMTGWPHHGAFLCVDNVTLINNTLFCTLAALLKVFGVQLNARIN